MTMTRYRLLPIETQYWKPGDNYLLTIVKSIKGKVANNDIIVVSEKAISIALNNIIDENKIKPTAGAESIAVFWMPKIWGYVLGPVSRLRRTLITRIRRYPKQEGSRHKQTVLERAGLLQALMFGSEGGIDGSNLPYAYVSLPLKNPSWIARVIRKQVQLKLQKNVAVMIVDTDRTYSVNNFHFTPRPKPMKGIHSFGGFLSYVVARFFKFEKRATPLAISGRIIPVGEALHIAELANRCRGSGAGRTVWEMAEGFHVKLTGVTWQMLDGTKHKPIIIVRKKR